MQYTLECLRSFSETPITPHMINILVNTTTSILHTPASPISLYKFIKKLINYSNVQTPTLMATLVYLTKLKNVFPYNITGMETSCHRIFLGMLIISSKTLNDSSPLNKHWSKYTDGLLSLKEVNLVELELIKYLNWDLRILPEDLEIVLENVLAPIRSNIVENYNSKVSSTSQDFNNSLSSSMNKSVSTNSVLSLESMSTVNSTFSRRKPLSNISINKSLLKSGSDKPSHQFKAELDNPFVSPKNHKSNITKSDSWETIASTMTKDTSYGDVSLMSNSVSNNSISTTANTTANSISLPSSNSIKNLTANTSKEFKCRPLRLSKFYGSGSSSQLSQFEKTDKFDKLENGPRKVMKSTSGLNLLSVVV